MKINQIACSNYSNKQNFCGRLALNSADYPNDIELIDTRKIKSISKPQNNCFNTNINVIGKGNIQVNHPLADVLQAYTAACQDEFVTIDISARCTK